MQNKTILLKNPLAHFQISTSNSPDRDLLGMPKSIYLYLQDVYYQLDLQLVYCTITYKKFNILGKFYTIMFRTPDKIHLLNTFFGM